MCCKPSTENAASKNQQVKAIRNKKTTVIVGLENRVVSGPVGKARLSTNEISGELPLHILDCGSIEFTLEFRDISAISEVGPRVLLEGK